MNWRKILYPLSLPYWLATSLRNWAFDRSVLAAEEFEVPVISVGNLSTGGTGKTPMVEFLIRHFSSKRIGFVSRGYGRSTKGLIIATPDHKFEEIGDEPFQIFHKFPDIKMALAEKRINGIHALLQSDHPEVILLDDAYQHRYVKPGFQILLTTFEKPFYKDALLPAGNLRESKRGKQRADLIIVTKCPEDLSASDAAPLRKKLKAGDTPVYFSGLEYGEPLNQMEVTLPTTRTSKKPGATVVTGIANPRTMLDYLQQYFHISSHLRFPDHHNFSKSDIERIEKSCLEKDEPLITTEKDWVRLQSKLSKKVMERTFYLPIEVKMMFGEEGKLLSQLRAFITNFNASE